jgi:diacylglycerol O-acyltransferase / wax synthase
MGTERLTAADAAWLRLDRPENLMVVTAVLWMGGRIDRGRLRALLAERLVATHPRFRSVVRDRPLPLVPPEWVPDPAFDLDRHLTVVELGEREAGEAALQRLVGEYLARPFDAAERPPWQLVLVDGYRPHPGAPSRSVLVGRLHHALADGAALVRVLLDLADGAGAPPAPPEQADRGLVRLAAGLALAVPVTAIRLLLLPPEPRTPLHGRLGITKDAAWAAPRPLARVKEVAAEHGATVNDVLLAAVAGGFSRYLQDHGPGTSAERLRVFVPVDLGAGERRLGNRFGLLPLSLPVAAAGAAARLRQLAAQTRAAKGSPVPAATFVLIGVLGVVPAVVRDVAAQVLGSKVTAIVTNVPGPQQQLTLAGVPVEGIAFWVPQAAAVGVGVSLFSYNGTVRIGVAVDAGLVPQAQHLADALDAELGELLTQPRRAPVRP